MKKFLWLMVFFLLFSCGSGSSNVVASPDLTCTATQVDVAEQYGKPGLVTQHSTLGWDTDIWWYFTQGRRYEFKWFAWPTKSPMSCRVSVIIFEDRSP